MPFSDLFNSCQPVQLYIVLTMSSSYFIVQLALSHITHALTLLMASYHMLCNIFALIGCIVTIKHSRKRDDFEMSGGSVSSLPNGPNKDQIIVINMSGPHSASATRQRREMKLRNTFGWTRIDILTMLIVFIILASLSFSLVVEALQTLVHIDHQDTMHLPVTVMILGFVGLILNGLTYLLIGGYTMHQGSFLHVTPSGDVVLDRVLSTSGELEADERQLSKPDKANREIDRQLKNDLKADIGRIHYIPKRQGAVEMLRDVSSTIFVIVCALIVNMAEDEEHTAKFIDPVLSIFSCVLLVSLSYPYMKQSCLILLQTIPGSIDMEDFERTMVTQFPEIVSYHDLHIWQLSAHKSVATVHIMFENPQLYTKIIDDVRAFFHDRGITEITIQPEFQSPKSPSIECLMQCSALDCLDKVCCKDSRTDLREVISASPNGGSDTQLHKHSSTDDKAEPAKPVDVKYLDAKEIENNAEKPATPNMQEVTENKSESIEENVMAKNKAAEGTSGTDSSEHNLATTEEMHSTEEKSEKSTERKYMEVAMPNEMDKTS
ncbi:proton-coupled zinc antiporter SLC30A1 isoform X1 [Anastrepha obliqua]|uniref:proton-coupled zinc antiporter SLC30A1 isoform X1 n=1 Tax=Anastrepha obliqua TaxID=95512 RepID=UPI00240A4425|nr:proton-coupled zinc antiporter SLC30A1 isoform X1 [Anastrepha obliqua]